MEKRDRERERWTEREGERERDEKIIKERDAEEKLGGVLVGLSRDTQEHSESGGICHFNGQDVPDYWSGHLCQDVLPSCADN